MHITKKHIKILKIRSLRSINPYNTKKRYPFQYRFESFLPICCPFENQVSILLNCSNLQKRSLFRINFQINSTDFRLVDHLKHGFRS